MVLQIIHTCLPDKKILALLRCSMKIAETVKDLSEKLSRAREGGCSIGFVPTMGALHSGHISLVERAKRENTLVLCSIFVNPAQFNDPADLEKYPRTPAADIEMLERAECDILFMPPVSEIYPQGEVQGEYDFGYLENIMEGRFRKGHFKGVGRVVARLFRICGPVTAYFGEKDFQQLAVIRMLVEKYHLPARIVGCPVIRENDGLAMSSRNVLLSAAERKDAVLVSRALFAAQEKAAGLTISEVKKLVHGILKSSPLIRPEYFEIVDGDTLLPLAQWEDAAFIRACIAVKIGHVRLIDNVPLNVPPA